MVRPAVVSGGGKWAVAEMDMKRFSTWDRKILRRIYGPVVEQGIWRKITDQEFFLILLAIRKLIHTVFPIG